MTRVRRNRQSDRRKSAPRWDPAFLRGRVRNDRQKTMEMFPGISMDPDIRFGKPCITGTRIDVATLVGAVAAGETVETVAEEYALTVEQVRSALSYAAHVAAHLPPAVRQAS
jgi:uncharacterized protein (DUF433 family)